MAVIRVALDVPVDELFDYVDDQADGRDVGCLAEVPFGRFVKVGVVMEVSATSKLERGRLKPVRYVHRSGPRLSAEILGLLRFCSDYYCHPVGPAVVASLPTLLRRPRRPDRQAPTAYQLTELGRTQSPDALKRSPVRRAVLQAFGASPRIEVTAAASLAPTALRVIREFVEMGWLEALHVLDTQGGASPTRPLKMPVDPQVPVMSAAQADAVRRISASLETFAVFLLNGVTGSGKTEVYLRLMEAVLRAGRQALLLVPEINLTPQLEARVAARFGDSNVVSLHSGLGEGERLRRWNRAVSGHARIVVGTRLSVFTPMPDLGVILVDEEDRDEGDGRGDEQARPQLAQHEAVAAREDRDEGQERGLGEESLALGIPSPGAPLAPVLMRAAQHRIAHQPPQERPIDRRRVHEEMSEAEECDAHEARMTRDAQRPDRPDAGLRRQARDRIRAGEAEDDHVQRDEHEEDRRPRRARRVELGKAARTALPLEAHAEQGQEAFRELGQRSVGIRIAFELDRSLEGPRGASPHQCIFEPSRLHLGFDATPPGLILLPGEVALREIVPVERHTCSPRLLTRESRNPTRQRAISQAVEPWWS